MIVCCLGYGYLAKTLLKELCSHGVRSIGLTSKEIEIENNQRDNLILFSRENTSLALKKSTHLIITAPPSDKGCPVMLKFSKEILNSNISSVLYISTTGVYGNHKGQWVNENSKLKCKSKIDKNRLNAEESWKRFSKKNKLGINILRLGAIYGPLRINSFRNRERKILIKKNHYFSRIHVYDISRIITKILMNGFSREVWNLVDEEPCTREDYLMEIIYLKNIKTYHKVKYSDEKVNMEKSYKKYWENNKRVSNFKVKKKLDFVYIFPTYRQGLKSLSSEL